VFDDFEPAEATPLEHAGVSGSTLERVRGVDGRVVVVKTEQPISDWLAKCLGDDGRLVRLWSAGFFARLPESIDCAIEAVERIPTGWRVVMRDVTANLVPADRPLSRRSSQQIMRAIASMHREFAGANLDGLCPLVDRYWFLTPTTVQTIATHPLGAMVTQGWARFPEVAPADVSDAMLALLEHPAALATVLSRYPATLLHGDLKMANIGLDGDRVVLLDWGSLTGWGPAAIDHTWYLAVNGAAVDASLDELLADMIEVLAPEDRDAVPLALLGGLLQLGWEKALGATAADPAVRARESLGLAWWCRRAAEALETHHL